MFKKVESFRKFHIKWLWFDPRSTSTSRKRSCFSWQERVSTTVFEVHGSVRSNLLMRTAVGLHLRKGHNPTPCDAEAPRKESLNLLLSKQEHLRTGRCGESVYKVRERGGCPCKVPCGHPPSTRSLSAVCPRDLTRKRSRTISSKRKKYLQEPSQYLLFQSLSFILIFSSKPASDFVIPKRQNGKICQSQNGNLFSTSYTRTQVSKSIHS